MNRPRMWISVGLLCVASVTSLIYYQVRAVSLGALLVRTWPNEVVKDAALVHFAVSEAPATYHEHCASCHGPQRQGNRAQGVPNLAHGVWLYGTGTVADIEQTILYGIRSGHPKSHSLVEMPALGRSGQLTRQDILDVVEYILLLSNKPHDEAASERGKEIFLGGGVCYDCHGSDAYGVSDYGTPPLTGRGGSWIYGDDRDTLYQSIYDGRHGRCPAWIGKLTFEQIRALSVYLYETHHE